MSLEAMTLDGIATSSVAGRIVTGAGQGIGRVFAKAFAGAIPAIADKNDGRLADQGRIAWDGL
jgi:NAD(P)-dependent dehydrogenase (short-subunit alcohol dehydrogenase family)